MKTLTTLLLLVPTMAFAQSNTPVPFFAFQGGIYHSNPLTFEYQLLKNLDGKQIKKVTKKTVLDGKKEYTSTFTLNEFGKPIEITKGDKYKARIDYINDTLPSQIVIENKKIQKTNYNYVDGRLILQESFIEDRLKTRSINQYDEDGNLIYSSLNRGKRRSNYSMFYTYRESDVAEQRYMRNNRVIRVWNYTCDPKGEDIEAKVKTNVCKYKQENADGSYIEYSRQEFEENVILVKRYFNPDSLEYKAQSFLNDSTLQWERHNDGSEFCYLRYDKKGKVNYKSETVLDKQGRMTRATTYWKGKEKKASTVEYDYNEDGTLAEERSLYKEKVTRVTTYEYTI